MPIFKEFSLAWNSLNSMCHFGKKSVELFTLFHFSKIINLNNTSYFSLKKEANVTNELFIFQSNEISVSNVRTLMLDQKTILRNQRATLLFLALEICLSLLHGSSVCIFCMFPEHILKKYVPALMQQSLYLLFDPEVKC